MKPRIDARKYVGLGVGKAMLTLSNETAKLMDPKLFELVKIRASQLNGWGLPRTWCPAASAASTHRSPVCSAKIFAASQKTALTALSTGWTPGSTQGRYADCGASTGKRARITTTRSGPSLISVSGSIVVRVSSRNQPRRRRQPRHDET